MFLPKPVEMQRQCAQSSSCMENPTFGIIRVQKQGGACHDILTTQVNNIRQLQGTLDTHFSINSYIWQHLICLVRLLFQANQMVVVTGCNLRWWHFFFSHLCKHCLHWWLCHPLQLVLVVFFLPPSGAHTPLALEQLVLCGSELWWWQLHVKLEVVVVAIGWW